MYSGTFCSQNDLIEPVVAPRFATTCSQPLLCSLGDLAREMNVPVHSHICQQREEVMRILLNNPMHRDCASIFDTAGMLNSRVSWEGGGCTVPQNSLVPGWDKNSETPSQGSNTQHKSRTPDEVPFQRNMSCLRWDSNSQHSAV